ncbi:MAG: hypothetical protein LBR15_02355 [Methanobrevibacter sp.]|jgi:uncharacterized membrane protein|nr:hypothetical protein [Candidatus Methanovirga australis]
MKLKYKSDEILGILLFVSAVTLFASLFSYLNNVIWLDEYFTLYSIVTLPFNQMMHNIAIDVHPPLYYIILYSLFQILEFFKVSFNEILVGKLFSLIPIGLLLIFNLIVIKKEFGWLFCGIYSLCIVALPNFMFYWTEIRMYSLLLLLVFLAFFYSYKITKKSSLKNWVLLTLISILVIYTQYFAIYFVVSIYLILLSWFIIHDKRNEMKTWFISLIIGILSSLPLILLLNYQIGVGKASWIPLPTSDSLIEIFKFIFVPGNEILIVTKISKISILLFLCFAVLIMHYYLFYLKIKFRKLKTKFSWLKEIVEKQEFLVLGFGVLILSIVLSFLVSYFFVSNFQARYLFPSLGILYFFFTFLLTKTYSKKVVFIPIILILLLSCSFASLNFINNQKDSIISNNEYEGFMHSVDENNTMIISTNYFRWSIITFYTNNNLNYNTFLHKPGDGYNTDDQTLIEKIDDSLMQSKDVYLFFTSENLDDLKKLLHENGFKIVEIKKIHETQDNCLYYPTVIYRIVKV